MGILSEWYKGDGGQVVLPLIRLAASISVKRFIIGPAQTKPQTLQGCFADKKQRPSRTLR